MDGNGALKDIFPSVPGNLNEAIASVVQNTTNFCFFWEVRLLDYIVTSSYKQRLIWVPIIMPEGGSFSNTYVMVPHLQEIELVP